MPESFTVPVAFKRVTRIAIDEGTAPQFLCAGLTREGQRFGVYLFHPSPDYPQLQVTFEDGSLILRAGLQTLIGAMLERAGASPGLAEEFLSHVAGLKACLAAMEVETPDSTFSLLDLFGPTLAEVIDLAERWEEARAVRAEAQVTEA